MLIISIANQKGGVAKTTTALNLGAGLNQEGYKALLIDLDSQTDLTTGLGIPKTQYTISDVLQGRAVSKAIIKLDNGISIIPADKDLKSIQMNLSKFDILSKALKDIKNDYDYIVMDTSPGINVLTINAILTSNMILIPITPEYLALRGLKDFSETIEQLNKKFDLTPAKIKILITNYDQRKGHHREAVQLIEKHFKKELLNIRIRTNVSLTEAISQAQNIYEYQPLSHGSQDYKALTKEIIKENKK